MAQAKSFSSVLGRVYCTKKYCLSTFRVQQLTACTSIMGNPWQKIISLLRNKMYESHNQEAYRRGIKESVSHSQCGSFLAKYTSFLEWSCYLRRDRNNSRKHVINRTYLKAGIMSMFFIRSSASSVHFAWCLPW